MDEIVWEFVPGRTSAVEYDRLAPPLPPGWTVHNGDGRFISRSAREGVTAVVDGHAGMGSGSHFYGAEAVLEAVNHNPALWPGNLQGEFVASVFDTERGTVQVARDPMGVRPLFLATSGRSIALSTSVRGILSIPWVRTTPNEQHIVEYISGLARSTGNTFYSEIQTVLPGTMISIDRDGDFTTSRYHNWDFTPDLTTTFSDAVEIAREAFKRASIPVSPLAELGVEVSGGLDSSAVAGALRTHSGPDFLIGRLLFEDERADERQYSDAVIAELGAESISIAPWIPDPDEQAELMVQTGIPLPIPNSFMAVALHREFLARGRPWVSTGVGGDDAFALAPSATRAVDAIHARNRAEISRYLRWTRENPSRAWSELIRPTLIETAGNIQLRSRARWVPPAVRRKYEIDDHKQWRAQRVSDQRAINYRWHNITSGQLSGNLETIAAISDTVGTRLWHPYLAVDFVQAVYNLNPNHARARESDRSLQREALGGYLPVVVRERHSKAEFSATTYQVMRHHNFDSLKNGPLAQAGLVEPRQIGLLQERFFQRSPGAAKAISRLYATDQWLRWRSH